MKIAILIGDGMGDYPLPELGGKTFLQVADIPNIRRIAAAGEVCLVRTIPEGMPPGSDVANLSTLGFDPRRYYTGRAPIEAAGAGLRMQADDLAYRCNLITAENGIIQDHSAGHITTEEARPLIDELNRRLGRKGLYFVVGTGYRHLVIWKDGPDAVKTTPPHSVLGESVESHLPTGPRSDELLHLMNESSLILAANPLIQAKRKAGKKVPTQIWLWGQGRRTTLPSYKELYGLSGGIISAVDLLRGIGQLAGLKSDKIPGATGFLDTDFGAKVKAALNILAEHDFVFVHLEAPDECGHMGNSELKRKAIEAFDQKIVAPIWKALQAMNESYRLIIGTDHYTPVRLRNHTCDPVPIALLKGPVDETNTEASFDEFVNDGRASGLAFEWLKIILKQAHK